MLTLTPGEGKDSKEIDKKITKLHFTKSKKETQNELFNYLSVII